MCLLRVLSIFEKFNLPKLSRLDFVKVVSKYSSIFTPLCAPTVTLENPLYGASGVITCSVSLGFMLISVVFILYVRFIIFAYINPTIIDYNNGSVTLNISVSDVINDVQNMKIYASGYRIANISLKEDDIGKELSFEIPEKSIEKGDVHLRIVFKNAVTPSQIGILDDDRIMSIAINRMWFE